MQKFRVALDNRNARREKCFCKVVQFGMVDAIQPGSSACFPPLGPGLGAPHVALCSFCPLPQPCSVNWKCSEGCGMPRVRKFRVALDNRNALGGKCVGKVIQFGMVDAIQPGSSACFSPLGPGLGENVVHLLEFDRCFLHLFGSMTAYTPTMGIFSFFLLFPADIYTFGMLLDSMQK
jgi:hypothetical protein